jgi:hypothetical protein
MARGSLAVELMASHHASKSVTGFNGEKIATGTAGGLIAVAEVATDEGLLESVLVHRAPVHWMMLNGQTLPQ